jgi:hypothetical protein
MSKINFRDTMSIKELRAFIPAVGEDLTVVVQSEPGCGKTSLLAMIASDNGDKWRKVGDNYPDDKYDYIYVDCPVKDMADIGMAIPNHTTKTLEYYVASLFKMSNGKPKYVLLDEFMKSPKLMQVIYTRLMLERTVGDEPLPERDGRRSVVFATSNNAADMVGDSMLAHAGNRVCIVPMAKPTVDEWLTWATEAGVSRVIRTFVKMFPRSMASYMDGEQDDNPYIFHPKKSALSFCSPRSLYKADAIVAKRDRISENAVMVGLCGTIGMSAAKDMAALLSLDNKLLDVRDEIIVDPKNVAVPDDIAAQLMIMFQAVDVLETQDELSSFMEFVDRIKSSEIQAVFFTMMMRNTRTIRLARNNKSISTWASNNHELF